MKEKTWEVIGAFLIFGIFRLFSLGSNYEALVITILTVIYWRITVLAPYDNSENNEVKKSKQ